MITLRNLSLQRGTKLLFNEVNITINAGQKVGFIGANGSGKSSLFALLLEQLHQDAGDVELPSSLIIAHVAQEMLAVSMPAIEYVIDGDKELREIEAALAAAQQAGDGMREASLHAQFEAIDGYTARARAAQLMHGLGFAVTDDEKPVKEFSGGWRMRLNLACALMCRSDLLLLDEPTNHLDLDAVLWFEQWLKRYPGTLLLISHDRDFLDNVVDTIAHIEQQNINLYTGNYEAYERQRAAKLALQQATYQKQQREIAHIQSFVDRFRYKATKAKQAQSRINALARMEKIAAAHIDSAFNFSFPPISQKGAGGDLIRLEKVSVGYTDTPVLEKIMLRIVPGSRLGLLGPNGAGKSTLIKLLAGQLKHKQGQCTLGEGLQIGYFAQHQLEQLRGEDSPLQHLQRLDTKTTEQSLRNFMGGFGFVGDMALAPVAPFSGGEKARLALALLVWQRPNVLLLDEPTNHLDLEMRHALTLALQDYAGALVIVSHDRHLLRTTTEELLLVANGRVKAFEGDLADYRQWLFEHRKSSLTLLDKRGESSVGKKYTDQTLTRLEKKRLEAQQREQRRPLQNRLKKIEKELDKLTAEKAAVEALLANPASYEDKNKVNDYIRQQVTLAEQLVKTEETWLEVTEALEDLDLKN
ncbi:MAG: ABC transporter ATP-binding protein [Candidatus Parabeggiatoa sp. nov. 2]|nr:MAG: ABC transporter ATP-binding protein [Beggiatoa sp. 4572_84]RKZ56518.1 MAG: ABC transporter ATP-binding protein [Gammaproteobacteria bacterium]